MAWVAQWQGMSAPASTAVSATDGKAGDDRYATDIPASASTAGLPRLASDRLQAVIGQQAPDRRRSTLAVYFSLQQGRWWEWLTIWLLQNARFAPVYLLPLLTGHLIDRVTGPAAQPTSDLIRDLGWALLATVGLCVVTVASNTYGRIMLSRISRTLTASLRCALIRRVNKIDLAYHDRSETGSLQTKFTLDMHRLEGVESFLADGLLMYGTVVVVMLAIIAWNNLLVFVVLAVAVPLNVLLARAFWGRITGLNAEYREAETGFLAKLNEALDGLRLTRAHATERFVEERIARAASKVASKGMRLDLMSNLFGSGSWAISTFLNMCVIGLGVWLIASGPQHFVLAGQKFDLPAMTIGAFTVLLSYYGTISGAIGALLANLPAVSAANDAITSLSQLYEAEGEQSSRHRQPLPILHGDVTLARVGFNYPGADSHCLADIDLRLPARTSLALVGPSGGGKSTIASLILGFYEPTQGQILIDNVDLRALDRRSYRKQVGVVSQDVVLFHDSILANIAWGDRRPDHQRARRAAERAQALEFIERLPGGLLHVLGDHGIGLSGGQRQRLAIARALYRDPRLLILDEATSALDSESERLVQQALDEVRRDRTTLIIAHRLSTIRKADTIAVIKDGRVVESGTFTALMERNGVFTQLAAGQLAH
jgi:ATP-binding cassette subfamily B protein